jgi:hypothetical protein
MPTLPLTTLASYYGPELVTTILRWGIAAILIFVGIMAVGQAWATWRKHRPRPYDWERDAPEFNHAKDHHCRVLP